MLLQIGPHDFVGCARAEFHSRGRRQNTRIGGEEVAAGGEHVAASTRRRTGRARRHALPIKSGEQCRPLSIRASLPSVVVGLGIAAISVQAILHGKILQIA